jgi:hydroxyacylglutathione hydrolase
MLFRQILHEDLGCASYVIADAGVAAVVDPKWEIEEYLALADEHGLEIRHVLETHEHADHVSGHGRLAEATGAVIYGTSSPGLGYPQETLADGRTIEFGSVRIEALATPGHRPEHTAYVVFDLERGRDPWHVLTGDSLFVGDVARPDLAVEAGEGAAGLHASLRRLLELPDHVQVWPGHIGGSLCGSAAMSETPVSTIGFERRFNPLLQVAGPEEFASRLLTSLKPQPPNFRRIVALNRGPLLTQAAELEELLPQAVETLLNAGATLVDGREPRAWARSHVPGSISATIVHAAVGSRAAAAVDPESEVVVTAASEGEARAMARRLEAVGFRRVRGYLSGGIEAWRAAGLPLEQVESIGVEELARRLAHDELVVLDVRDPDEFETAHVHGSLHVPYQKLAGERLAELRSERNGKALAVVCGAGNRSSLAVSLLLRSGIERVVHVGGGVEDLAGLDVQLTRGSA